MDPVFSTYTFEDPNVGNYIIVNSEYKALLLRYGLDISPLDGHQGYVVERYLRESNFVEFAENSPELTRDLTLGKLTTKASGILFPKPFPSILRLRVKQMIGQAHKTPKYVWHINFTFSASDTIHLQLLGGGQELFDIKPVPITPQDPEKESQLKFNRASSSLDQSTGQEL